MAIDYISYIPKPLLDDFINNRVVPFVGAGFSKNADIPSGISMPDWNGLGELVAAEISDYDYDNNPIDALSYYESMFSRTKLVEFIMKALHVEEIKPGATYVEFCNLFTGTICTTNYDFLLEKAMQSLSRPISTIVTEDRLTVNSSEENRIIKLHGDFNHPDKMVITEHDYDVYLENNPVFATYVSNLFITNTMLLIGYSLDDADFRGIWQIINNRLGKMAQPAYCIVVEASQAQIARYLRRNIRVINLPGKAKDYKKILHDFFVQLNKYISEEKKRTAKSKDERINDQLVIPSDDNRLCFVSCSMSRTAQLSSLIYPILYRQGVIPVRLDDMLMPGENRFDVVRTIISKSKVAIVDVSDQSPAVFAELAMLRSEKKKTKIVCERGVDLPTNLLNPEPIYYSLSPNYEEYERLIKQLNKWIDSSFKFKTVQKNKKNKTKNIINNKNNSNIFISAKKLMDAGQYSACIVSAYSEFIYLTRNKAIYELTIRTTLKGSILVVYNEVEEIEKLRNRIVHGAYVATKDDASKALITLVDILKNIGIE